jgi:hypothetical protein
MDFDTADFFDGLQHFHIIQVITEIHRVESLRDPIAEDAKLLPLFVSHHGPNLPTIAILRSNI